LSWGVKKHEKRSRSTASLPDDIISLIPSEVKYRKAEGEADVAISTMDFDSIVISGDSDLFTIFYWP
jgi:hypothetical protein